MQLHFLPQSQRNHFTFGFIHFIWFLACFCFYKCCILTENLNNNSPPLYFRPSLLLQYVIFLTGDVSGTLLTSSPLSGRLLKKSLLFFSVHSLVPLLLFCPLRLRLEPLLVVEPLHRLPAVCDRLHAGGGLHHLPPPGLGALRGEPGLPGRLHRGHAGHAAAPLQLPEQVHRGHEVRTHYWHAVFTYARSSEVSVPFKSS